MKLLSEFKDIHKGRLAYLVGMGPSLGKLCAKDFVAPDAPIFCIQESIQIVEDLGLPNPLYSSQKDHYICDVKRAQLLLCKQESARDGHRLNLDFCCFDPVDDLGFDTYGKWSCLTVSAIARYMGCDSIVYICFDSIVNGDGRRYKPDFEGNAECTSYGGYFRLEVIPWLEENKIPHEFRLGGESPWLELKKSL